MKSSVYKEHNTPCQYQGFTLIEMVMTIALTGIVAVMISTITSNIFSGYQDLSRRTEAVSIVDISMQILSKDIKNALPNSVRVDASGTFLEYVPIIDAGRYRTVHSGISGSDILDFTQADGSFQIIGDISLSSNDRIVIYNTGQTGANLYEIGSEIITPSTSTLSYDSATKIVSISAPFHFDLESPQKRFYIVSTPVTFHCDVSNQQLLKFSDYSLLEVQPSNTGAAPLSSATTTVLADKVSACNFIYDSGTSEHNALVTLSLTITDEEERSQLIQQVHVSNVP